MSTLLKKQIAYSENIQNASFLTKAWLLLLHVILGAYHVFSMLFMSSSSSFQQVNDLTNEGYRVSYLDHCRMQHNVRFGTLAYSLVLVVALTLVRTTVEIVYPEQFGQAAYAANLVVTKSADTNDGVCDADCSLREAINVANNNDTVTFAGDYTINLGSGINYPGGRTNITVDGGSNTIVINGGGTVGNCVQWNGSGMVLRKVTIQNCTSSALNISASSGAILDQVTLSGPAGAANSPLVAGSNMELSNSTVSASGARDCINVNGNNQNIHHNTITNCQNGIFTANGTTGTFSNNTFRATSSYAIRVNLNGGGHTISNNTFGQAGGGNQVNGGVYIGSNSTGNTISNNTLSFQNGGNAAFYLFGSQVGSGTNNTLSNNTVNSSVVGTAFRVENSTRNLISGNTVTDSSLNGVQLQNNAANNTITGNTITSVPNGINVTMNSSNPTITNNSITPDSGPGVNIGLNGANGAVVTGNTVIAGGVGGNNTLISLNATSNANISSNTLSTPSNGDSSVIIIGVTAFANSNNNTISNNTITVNAAGGFGISLQSGSNTVSNNTVQSANSGTAGIQLNNANNVKIFGNTVTGIYKSAIELYGNSTNNIIGLDTVGGGAANIITNIGFNEISIQGGATNTYIRGNSITDNGDGVLVYYGSGSFAATATPEFITHRTTTITGGVLAGATVDLYGRNGNSYIYLGAVVADANGLWTYNSNVLTTYDDIVISSTVSPSGTSIFDKDAQPEVDMVLSDFNVETTSTTATATWTSSVIGNSKMVVSANGVDQTFNQTGGSTTTHTIEATGLTPNTDYTYQVRSNDVVSDYNFDMKGGSFSTNGEPDTTAPVISEVSVQNITTTSATISWVTDEPANSQVDYGSTDAYGDTATDDELVTTHSLDLSALSESTTYHYSVVSTDADNNTQQRADATFTTATPASQINYGDRVSQNATVTDAYNTSAVGAAGSHVDLPSTPSKSLTFTFTDSRKRFVGDRLHLVIALARQRQEYVINRKKAFDAQGKVSFEVKQSLLEVEKKYVVSTGIQNGNGDYVNNSGLAERFTFTLQDAPQILYPALSANNHVFIGMPEEFVVASKSPSVTVYLDDANGEVFHCTAAIVNGMGSCRPPFYPTGRGEYTLRLVDARGGTISTPLLLTALAANDTVTFDNRSADFYNRVILGGQPTFVGIAGEGNTVEVHVPQIDGAIVADRSGITWTLRLTLTTLPAGETNVTVIERRPDGTVVNNNAYRIYRSSRAVSPAVIAPADNSSDTVAPQIQVVGPTTGDHILEVFNSAGTRLVRTNYDNGGRTINLAQWFTQPGSYSISLVNRNRVNLPSRRVTFNFTIVSATPTITTPDTNTNTNNSTDTESNSNTNTNSNSNGSSDSNSNTNSNSNDNSNTSSETNTNSAENDNINSVNTNSVNTNGANTNTTTEATDPDRDGLTTTVETDTYNTDPNNPDTDSDDLYDGDEIEFGSDPLLPDVDEDGLTDAQEYTLKTNPRDADSDDDGALDGAEVAKQTNPIDADSDDDGLEDNEADEYGTLPRDADTDNDRILDGDEIDRDCDPLKADTDGDGIDDLTEALAGTACTSEDNLWLNLTGLEAYLQDAARSIYATTGVETASYPNLTTQVVAVDSDFKQKLNNSIRTATVVDYVAGAETVVSKGAVTVVTRTTELSLFDWLNQEAGTTSDDTFVIVQGQVDLPSSLQGQPAYVVVTFFSTPSVKIAQVDPNGQWTMTVPAELLSAGEHTAFASVDVNGTQSEQVEVAKFVIQNERKLSNTAWLVIINIVIAVVAALAAWFVRLRHKRANQEVQSV